MLRPEFYKDVIKFIVDRANKGCLCSEDQLERLAESLTIWRNPDWSQPTSSGYSKKAKILWKFLRNFTLEVLEEEMGFSYSKFAREFGGLSRDYGERAYWAFEDNNQNSLFNIFSGYLSGKESMTIAGKRLGWSRQAVQQVIVRVFGKEFPALVFAIRESSSTKKKVSSQAVKLHVQILKAGASLGNKEMVEKLLSFGGGKIVFTQRPDLLMFKSLTGKFKLMRGQRLATGDVVVDLSKLSPSIDFIVACVGEDFYKSNGVSNAIILASLKVDLSQHLRF